MRNVRTFTVVPTLPPRLTPLRDIAYNLWWTWNQEARDLFIKIDRNVWEATNHNPILMFNRVNHSRLKKLSEDDNFLANMERVKKNLDDYMSAKTWYDEVMEGRKGANVAYFSAEFGVH